MKKTEELSVPGYGSPLLRRLRRIGVSLATLALMMGMLLSLVAVVANVITGRRLERELARIRERGEPLTLREFAPPPVPDAENAALVYEQAFRRLPRPEAVRSDGKENPGRPANAVEPILARFLSDDPAKRRRVAIDQVRRALSGTDVALALARHAAAMPRCRFPVDWEAGGGALFPHYGPLLSLARLLGARAVLAARDGRTGESVADVEAVVALSRHLGTEPILIGQLVRYACLTVATNALERVLEAGAPGEDDRRRLCRSLSAIDLHEPFARTMEAERCFGLWAFEVARVDPARLTIGGEPYDLLRLFTAFRPLGEPLLKLDEIVYLKHMDVLVRRAQERRPFRPTDAFEVGAFPRYAVVSGFLVPENWTVSRKRDEVSARVALARWGLALRRFQEESGQYPSTLQEAKRFVVGELPLDPFTDRPLIYHRHGAGFLLYSVGSDRRDDGGRNQRGKRRIHRPSTPENDDIAWRLEH